MKVRRLLALVLCFVMLFSDATSTLASTGSGEPIVITDSSELQNLEVIDTEEPEAEAGTETIGDGAIKLKDVVLNSKCGICGKQDKNGKSLI